MGLSTNEPTTIGDREIALLKTCLIPGGERRLGIGGFGDVQRHLENLRNEFIGKPELCFLHAQLVVMIRRKIDLEMNVAAFFALWEREPEFLVQHLSSRWLISACDTFVDHGSDSQRSIAMLAVVFINLLKLFETERLAYRDATIRDEEFQKIDEKYSRKESVELWDDMVAFSPYKGDMAKNMQRRLFVIAKQDRVCGLILRSVMMRALEHDTCFARFARINPDFLVSELLLTESPSVAPTHGVNVQSISARATTPEFRSPQRQTARAG